MRILVEIELPYVYSISPLVVESGKSYLRLCDGPTDITYAGKTYLSGLLTEMSNYVHEVNIKQGGNLENVQRFEFTITNNNLLETIENQGYSINSGICKLSKIDDILGSGFEKLFYGYVVGSSLSNNDLTFQIDTASKLGQITTEKDYGVTKKKELPIDKELSNKSYDFLLSSGLTSKHPKILSISANGVPDGWTNGVQTHHLVTANFDIKIEIGHLNDAFINVGDTEGILVTRVDTTTYYINDRLYVDFVAGDSGNTSAPIDAYKIKSIKRLSDGPNYRTELTLEAKAFQSTNIRPTDRITISSHVAYYPIGAEDYTTMYVKDKEDKYRQINTDNYTIKTIGSQRYIVIYSRPKIYAKIPLKTDIVISAHAWADNGGYNDTNLYPLTYVVGGVTKTVPTDPTILNDEDLTSYIGFDQYNRCPLTGYTFNIYNDIYFKLYPDMSKYIGSDLYFGVSVDRPAQNYFETSFRINTYLNSGVVFPYNNDGNAVPTVIGSDRMGSGIIPVAMHAVPVGDQSSPITTAYHTQDPASLVIDPAYHSQYPSIYDPTFFTTMTQAKFNLGKIDLDKEVLKDIDYVEFTLRSFYDRTWSAVATHNESMKTLIYKMGLWELVDIDTPELLYVDVPGIVLSDITNPIDLYVKDILEDAGQVMSSDYGLGAATLKNNHYSTTQKSQVSKELINISKPANIIIGQNQSGEYYIKPVYLIDNTGASYHTPLNAQGIPSVDIFNVAEPLSDIDISEVVNFPKLIFKDWNNIEHFLEVHNLDGTFPTMAESLADLTLLDAFFNFSDNFWNSVLLDTKVLYPIIFNDIYHLFYNGILYPLYNACHTSFIKNGVRNSGDIEIPTIYLENLMSNVTTQVINNVLSYTLRRKTLKLELGWEYRNTKLGTNVSISDPRLYNNSIIYGYVSKVEVSLLPETKVFLTVLCDSYKLDTSTLFF